MHNTRLTGHTRHVSGSIKTWASRGSEHLGAPKHRRLLRTDGWPGQDPQSDEEYDRNYWMPTSEDCLCSARGAGDGSCMVHSTWKGKSVTTQARKDTARSHGCADFRLLEFYFGGRLWMRRSGFESFGSAERFDVCQLKTCLCLGSLATNLGGGGFLGDPEGLCEQILAFVRFGLHDSHIVHMDIVGFSCDEFFVTAPTGH